MTRASSSKVRSAVFVLSFYAGALVSASAQSRLPKCTEENISKHCFGVITAPDGNRYIGEMNEGKANGKGALIFTDGKRYEGQFRDGAPSGHGIVTHPDGESYNGNFKDGKKSGEGKLVSADGKIYVGQFKDDAPNGRGAVTMPDGKRYSGNFVNGELVVKPQTGGATQSAQKEAKNALPPCDVSMTMPAAASMGART